MTDKPTNRLLGSGGFGGNRPAYVEINGEMVPTNLDEYCAWLNERERRKGVWVIVQDGPHRALDFRTEVATDGWLRDKGLIPKIGRAA